MAVNLSNQSASGMDQNDTMNEFISNYGLTLYNIFLSFTMVFGVVGNMMVIAVILKTKKMQNSTNIFLANLAIADLILLLGWGGNILLTPDVQLRQNSPLSRILSNEMCITKPFVEQLATTASVLTILALSFERYYFVCKPHKADVVWNKNKAIPICIQVWAIAVLISSPELINFIDKPHNPWHCGELTIHPSKPSYYIISTVVLFFLPLMILIVLYSLMVWRLKRGDASMVYGAGIWRRRPVISMLATVVLFFFVFLLPFRVVFFINSLPHTSKRSQGPPSGEEYHLKLFICLLMSYLHSVVNPILYSFMSKRFRVSFKSVWFDIVNGFSRIVQTILKMF